MARLGALNLISGHSKGLVPCVARAVLGVLSVPYAGLMRLRRWAYRRGYLRSYQPAVPVISVGNLTVGGAGKTPMVAWIVRHLQQAGHRPAVLTRGYMPRGGGASDEAQLLRQLCAPAPVIVNPDRCAGARQGIEAGADVLVMDDGYQHLRLRRQLDIVLIDAIEPFGFGYVLPRGLLREPLSALQDADAIVLTRTDAVAARKLEDTLDVLRRHTRGSTFHSSVHQPTRLVDAAGNELPLTQLAGARVLGFCGLGNPLAFFATLERLGADLANRIALEDHTAYEPVLMEGLSAMARKAGAAALVTTAKDRTKLTGLLGDLPADMPLWTLEVSLDLVEGGQALVDRILSVHLASLQPVRG